jgi:general secretion pathway protein H
VRRERARGFTFIELMIVLAIAALGAVMVAPALDAGIDSREVRRAVRQLAATMQYCRREAVATGSLKRLRIKPDENRIETDDGARWAVLTERALIERVDGGWDAGLGMYDVAFFPNGSTSGAEILIVSRQDRSRNRMRLVLDPLVGTVHVEAAG